MWALLRPIFSSNLHHSCVDKRGASVCVHIHLPFLCNGIMWIYCHVLHINFRIIKHVTEAIMLSCTGNHENCQYMLLGNKLTILVDLLLCRLQVRVCYVTEFVPSLKHLVQNKSNGIKIMLQNRVSSFFRIYEARLSHLVTSLLPQPTFICSKPTMWTPEQCVKSVQS